jgi:protein subunit release factor A/Cdc6-like AAA superfamily ATPase
MEALTDRMFELLTAPNVTSFVLKGPSAVGKTAAIRHLAWRLKQSKCPSALQGFRVVQTSTADVLTGAKFLGVWQERLLELCHHGSLEKRVIIYWEDFANLISAGRVMDDKTRFLDVLVPRMERGEIVMIGELLPQQARQVFGQETTLARVVATIDVEEPPTDKVVQILKRVAQVHSGAITSAGALQEAITLSQVFVPYKALPGKALELLKGALDRGPAEGQDEIRSRDVMQYFCESTGIPEFIVDQSCPLDEKALSEFFGERVLGQVAATGSVAQAVTMFKSRLSDPERPIRSFLFVGPTGVGKTETARVLAEYLFGSPEKMIRLNMSEYHTADAVSKLIGSSWTMTTSSFLEQVREKPFSVVLLDEIEKADPAVLNLLLQLLGKGELADSDGKPAYFQSSIIIMTSNIGARRYTAQAIGFGSDEAADVKRAVVAEVMDFFSPEVFNRFDEVIAFEPLPPEALETIVNREIGSVLTRRGVIERNLTVDIDPLVIQYIVRTGYDPRYGARHIRRAVEAAVAVPLAVAASSGTLTPDDMIRLIMRDGRPVADVVRFSSPSETPSEATEPPPRPALGDISDRQLRHLLESTENKIKALKERVGYTEYVTEHERLHGLMAEATFWDKTDTAKNTLRKYAEVNRTLERVHRWERVFDQVMSSLPDHVDVLGRPAPFESRSRLAGLLKDLESAEMEALLEGKHDSADAFIVVRSSGSEEVHRQWLLDLVGMYTSWAARRGYRADVIGEQPDAGAPMATMMHVGGLNSYGLLKNEQGIHRLLVKSRPGDGGSVTHPVVKRYDCQVLILPDVQPEDHGEDSLRVTSRKITPNRRGWKIKLLSRQITLSDPATGETLQLCTDRKSQPDQRILADFFKTYVNHRPEGVERIDPAGQEAASTVIRTFEKGEKLRVRDHRTGMVISRTKDYLAGKIDALLLERLV